MILIVAGLLRRNPESFPAVAKVAPVSSLCKSRNIGLEFQLYKGLAKLLDRELLKDSPLGLRGPGKEPGIPWLVCLETRANRIFKGLHLIGPRREARQPSSNSSGSAYPMVIVEMVALEGVAPDLIPPSPSHGQWHWQGSPGSTATSHRSSLQQRSRCKTVLHLSTFPLLGLLSLTFLAQRCVSLKGRCCKRGTLALCRVRARKLPGP